jgi:DNA invertase Pin-like site-specific DNA recombinase
MLPARRAQPLTAQPAVAYLRRSTDRQEQSIPDQRRAIELFAAERGLVLDRYYCDDAISGTSTTRRKAFLEMVADAQATSPPPFGHVIAYDVKRFGRVGNDEAGYYRHLLRQAGVEVLYAAENFNGDATDDLLRPVKQWQAREESKDLSKVTIRGLLSKVPGGWWMGGVPPYGYDLRYTNDHGPVGEFLFRLRFMPDGTKQVLDEQGALVRTLQRGESLNISKRDRARLVPSHPERALTVDRIFRMSAEVNKGFRSIAETLNTDGIAPPRGPEWARIYHGQWTASTVRAILTNPTYVGDMVWNRRTDARFNKIAGGQATERKNAYGARLVPNPVADWIRVPDSHPPLVSRRLFEMAQEARETRPTSERQRGQSRRTVGGWVGSRSRFLLSGLIQCARCGGRYEGVGRSKGSPRRDGTKVRTYYYGCGTYVRRGKTACRFAPIDQSVLEAAIVEAVLAHYAQYTSESRPERLAAAVRDGIGQESEDLVGARLRAQERRAELTRTIANLLDNLTPTNRALVDDRLAVLAREKEEVERRIDELERMARARVEESALVGEAWEFLHELPAVLRHGSPEKRIRALRRCVSSVTLDAEARAAVLRLQRVPVAELFGRIVEVALEIPRAEARSGSA